MNSYVHVAVAVIYNQCGQVFITRRPDHVHQGGLWEFPGGKVESDESIQDALRREIKEEIDITIEDALPLIKIPFQYPDKQVLLDVWEVLQYTGEPHGREGQSCEWVNKEELRNLSFPAANHAIISAVLLPSCFLVTPEPGKNKTLFLKNLERTIQSDIRWLYFRAKNLSQEEYRSLAREVCEIGRANQVNILLNTETKLVKQLGAAGLHLTAKQLLECNDRPVGHDYWLSASCHTREEINHANSIGVDFIFVGSVKSTSSHPESVPIGWEQFSHLAALARMPVYAIGGMTQKDHGQSRLSGGQGIAAISALWKQ